MSKQLQLFKNESFNGVQCDFYEINGEKVLTREQLADAIGFTTQGIYKIAKDNNLEEGKDFYILKNNEVNLNSEFKLSNNKTYFYTIAGITIICMNATKNSKIARQFAGWTKEVISKVVNNGKYDVVEEAIEQQIEDEFEKKIAKQLKTYNDLIENATDNLEKDQIGRMIANKQQELVNYRQQKQLEEMRKLQIEQAQEIADIKQSVIDTLKPTEAEEFRRMFNNVKDDLVRKPKTVARCKEILKSFGIEKEDRYQIICSCIYKLLEIRTKSNLNTRLKHYKNNMIVNNPGVSKTQLNLANKLDVICADVKLMEATRTILMQLQSI